MSQTHQEGNHLRAIVLSACQIEDAQKRALLLDAAQAAGFDFKQSAGIFSAHEQTPGLFKRSVPEDLTISGLLNPITAGSCAKGAILDLAKKGVPLDEPNCGAPNRHGFVAPLMSACLSGNLLAAKELIQAGANMDLSSNGPIMKVYLPAGHDSLLIAAASSENSELIKLLLKSKKWNSDELAAALAYMVKSMNPSSSTIKTHWKSMDYLLGADKSLWLRPLLETEATRPRYTTDGRSTCRSLTDLVLYDVQELHLSALVVALKYAPPASIEQIVTNLLKNPKGYTQFKFDALTLSEAQALTQALNRCTDPSAVALKLIEQSIRSATISCKNEYCSTHCLHFAQWMTLFSSSLTTSDKPKAAEQCIRFLDEENHFAGNFNSQNTASALSYIKFMEKFCLECADAAPKNWRSICAGFLVRKAYAQGGHWVKGSGPLTEEARRLIRGAPPEDLNEFLLQAGRGLMKGISGKRELEEPCAGLEEEAHKLVELTTQSAQPCAQFSKLIEQLVNLGGWRNRFALILEQASLDSALAHASSTNKSISL